MTLSIRKDSGNSNVKKSILLLLDSDDYWVFKCSTKMIFPHNLSENKEHN